MPAAVLLAAAGALAGEDDAMGVVGAVVMSRLVVGAMSALLEVENAELAVSKLLEPVRPPVALARLALAMLALMTLPILLSMSSPMV